MSDTVLLPTERPDPSATAEPAPPVVLRVRGLDFWYGGYKVLKNIHIDIPRQRITAFIGPSGCGKSTLLRTFNRSYELYPDQRATGEELVAELKEEYTVAIVTHNMQQAARLSDYTAFMYLGELVEFGETDQIFVQPRHKQTEG